MEIESDLDFYGQNISSNKDLNTKIYHSPDLNNENTNTKESSNQIMEIFPKRVFTYKKPTNLLSTCEIRLKKDIEELKKNKNIGKVCPIKINDYQRIQDTDNFQMIIDFVNYFSAKFVFPSDYPFEPPIITFYSGEKLPFIFDSDGNIMLENSKKLNWTPIFWVSTLVNSIELLILKGLNHNIFNTKIINLPKKMKYGKRKWDDYIKEEKSVFKNNTSIINELTKTLKGLKSLN